MFTRFLLFLGLVLLVPGCSQFNQHMLTPAYHPKNVFVWGSGMPAGIRRVALLPMACEPNDPDLVEGCDALAPVIQQELAKTHKFEVTPITEEALRSRTGKPVWNCEEMLPQDFLSWLGDACGCDAVMFCRLTVFRGYAPLAVGWRMRLVEIKTKRTLWAGDEVFDDGLPAVQSGARQFQLAELQRATAGPEEWIIENSPRQFGQYAAAELFATLPGW
jgi:hypothetical protein